jgi:hypothetical protein
MLVLIEGFRGLSRRTRNSRDAMGSAGPRSRHSRVKWHLVLTGQPMVGQCNQFGDVK